MFRLLALAQKLGRTIICTPSLLITLSLIDPFHRSTEAGRFRAKRQQHNTSDTSDVQM